jgi:hypothetical protein
VSLFRRRLVFTASGSEEVAAMRSGLYWIEECCDAESLHEAAHGAFAASFGYKREYLVQ